VGELQHEAGGRGTAVREGNVRAGSERAPAAAAHLVQAEHEAGHARYGDGCRQQDADSHGQKKDEAERELRALAQLEERGADARTAARAVAIGLLLPRRVRLPHALLFFKAALHARRIAGSTHQPVSDGLLRLARSPERSPGASCISIIIAPGIAFLRRAFVGQAVRLLSI
jgi:hypothetical protein